MDASEGEVSVTALKRGVLPRYYQLKEIIRDKIRSAEWRPGDMIPSERELCERYGLSRMTVRHSLQDLVHEGVLYREQGRGTFVGRPKLMQQLLRLTGFTEDMRLLGMTSGARLLERRIQPAEDDVAARLHIKPGQPVMRIRRLRLADDELFGLETVSLAFVGCERLMEDDLVNHSLYSLLENRYGFPLVEAEQEMEATLAGKEEAHLIGLNEGDAVFLTRRVTYTVNQQLIEFARSVYRGDKYKFYTRMIRDHPANEFR